MPRINGITLLHSHYLQPVCHLLVWLRFKLQLSGNKKGRHSAPPRFRITLYHLLRTASGIFRLLVTSVHRPGLPHVDQAMTFSAYPRSSSVVFPGSC